MGNALKKEQREVLLKLVGNCITYNLKPEAELLYVKQELGVEVNIRTINKYKKQLREDETTRKWYSDFARFRFVNKHAKMMDDLDRMYDDTNRQIFVEQMKSPRNEGVIIRLKTLLIDIMIQIGEFSADTPTMDAIRAKIDKANKIEAEQERTPNKEAPMTNA